MLINTFSGYRSVEMAEEPRQMSELSDSEESSSDTVDSSSKGQPEVLSSIGSDDDDFVEGAGESLAVVPAGCSRCRRSGDRNCRRCLASQNRRCYRPKYHRKKKPNGFYMKYPKRRRRFVRQPKESNYDADDELDPEYHYRFRCIRMAVLYGLKMICRKAGKAVNVNGKRPNDDDEDDGAPYCVQVPDDVEKYEAEGQVNKIQGGQGCLAR